MKKKKNIVIILIILLLLFIIGYVRFQGLNYLDNILIFNLFENQENSDNTYVFDITEGKKQIANVKLHSTFNANGLANEKIEPGTNGEFNILLSTSKKLNYQIRFDSKNSKPQNLVFNIKGQVSKYSRLEDLEVALRGTLNKDDIREITIQWSWEYETNNQNDIQDTLDGKSITSYNFDINILSYEIRGGGYEEN